MVVLVVTGGLVIMMPVVMETMVPADVAISMMSLSSTDRAPTGEVVGGGGGGGGASMIASVVVTDMSILVGTIMLGLAGSVSDLAGDAWAPCPALREASGVPGASG